MPNAQILQNQKFLKYVQECPVKCLWLKSKIAHLSDPPTMKFLLVTHTQILMPIKIEGFFENNLRPNTGFVYVK